MSSAFRNTSTVRRISPLSSLSRARSPGCLRSSSANTSPTGLAEAPAKPREFYLARQQLALTMRPELADAAAREKFKGHLLHHDDPRLTEVAKGYAMQALLYQLTGEAFCDNPDCRLFNAHWQAELLHAQLAAGPEYCPRHESLLAHLHTRT